MIDKILELITNPFKALLATITGTAAGSVPKMATILADTQMTSFDRGFQHTVWALTSLVALSALITFVQKQIDRYKLKNQSHEKDS
jgi:hypothetical protein